MDKASENLSLLKDIQDIDDMLYQYCQNGLINREKAISKIRELRMTNDIRETIMVTLPLNPIPFSKANNNQLASELNAYKAILKKNYLRNTQKDTHADT